MSFLIKPFSYASAGIRKNRSLVQSAIPSTKKVTNDLKFQPEEVLNFKNQRSTIY